MSRNTWRLNAVLLVSSLALAMGCDRSEKASPAETSQAETSQAEAPKPEAEEKAAEPEAVDPRRATADKADQMLRKRLMGKVMATVKSEGFPAAVNVCHGEAGPLTQEVGEEAGVKIGRVADRLRNPENTGPDWVDPLIEKADGKPYYAVQGDALRAVKPLKIAQNCLNCHGQTDQLAEGVAEALQKHYPEDKATGYELGDLRGWVWVEVL